MLYRKFYALLLIVSFVLFNMFSALASTEEQAKKFMVDLGNQTLSILQSSKTDSEKEKQLITLFEQNTDTEWIGKFVLGRYWRTATPEQQKRYLSLYKQFIIQSYVPHFREYTGETFKVVSASQGKEKGEFLVQTEITRPNNTSNIRVDYRLREKNSTPPSYMIFDIIAEGVSLITTQRSEFGSIISNEGIDNLIQKLGNKIQPAAPLKKGTFSTK